MRRLRRGIILNQFLYFALSFCIWAPSILVPPTLGAAEDPEEDPRAVMALTGKAPWVDRGCPI